MTKCVSPWYNHMGWLGVKHQFAYLFTYSTARIYLSKCNVKTIGNNAPDGLV